MGFGTKGALVGLVGVSLATPASGQVLRLAWSDAHGLVPERDTVEHEVASLLAGTGLEITWTESPYGAAAWAPLLDVTIVISPSDPSGPGWNLSPTAMGVYLKSESSSVIFVFYERVARVMGLSSEGPLAPHDSRAMARALGRVVVHEVVHRIAPSLPHADVGVFRASLGRTALSSRRLDLDERSREALLSEAAASREKTASVRRDERELWLPFATR